MKDFLIKCCLCDYFCDWQLTADVSSYLH